MSFNASLSFYMLKHEQLM